VCLKFGESVKIRAGYLAHSVKTEKKIHNLVFILFGGFLYPAVLDSVPDVSGGGGGAFSSLLMAECVGAKEGGLSELRQVQKGTGGGMLLKEIIENFR